MPHEAGLGEVLRETSWLERATLLLAVLVPLVLAGWFAWYQRAQVLADAQRSASRSVVALEQHAANVLDTHSLILRQLDGVTRNRSWREIGDDVGLKQTFSAIERDFPQVSAVGMADATGRLWLRGDERFSEDVSVADRDFFIAHRNGLVQGTFVGDAFTSRADGVRQFGMSIARTGPTGAFDGVIFTAVPLEHFTSFWKQFTPSGGHVIPLLRRDGALIVRYPVLHSPERLLENGPFMTHLRQAPRGLYTAPSLVDGIERINAYSQIKTYPLYVSFSVETSLVLQQWRRLLVVVAGLAVIAAAMLAMLWLAVVRQSHLQRVSAAGWREVADRLTREVARREEAEEAMRQGRKMEAVGQLAGGIAHDFNNLLASIVGNLQLMRMRLLHGRTEELPRYIAAAEAVATRAGAMTRRLLAFSRRQALAPELLDVNQRIASMRELIAQTVGPSIRLSVALAPEPCTALCDPNELDNVLLNLSINARDAMSAGGELSITTALTSLGSAAAAALGLEPAHYVVIGMRDTGTGMDADVIERAFDPFFTTKPVGKGTGLGLSMVYGFVTQSGGQVKIDSAPGAGTTITIFLPAHSGAAPSADAPAGDAGTPRAAATVSILLVDDESWVREPLAELLAELGYHVLQAADGARGLEILNSGEPVDLLVSDLGLPGRMNGWQLAEAGRQLRPRLKVLFITGYGDQASLSGSSPGPEAETMAKPFALADFARKVSEMTAQADGGRFTP